MTRNLIFNLHRYSRLIIFLNIAPAIDKEETEYIVYWNTVEGWDQFNDESNCYDWDAPVEVIKS